LRHAAAAFSAAQPFDNLGHWGAGLDPKANEIPIGDDATVLTAQAPDHDHQRGRATGSLNLGSETRAACSGR
jgi:hypothetical protein